MYHSELWNPLKSFIFNSLKIKVATYPIIVSLEIRCFSLRIYSNVNGKCVAEQHFDPEMVYGW